jgi:hypothetical protein
MTIMRLDPVDSVAMDQWYDLMVAATSAWDCLTPSALSGNLCPPYNGT